MLAEKLIILTKVSARCICLVSIHNFGNVDIFRNHSYNFEETNNASFLLNRWLFATYILDILHITFKLRISIGRFCCINITWTALTFYEKAMGSKVFTLNLHLCQKQTFILCYALLHVIIFWAINFPSYISYMNWLMLVTHCMKQIETYYLEKSNHTFYSIWGHL